MTKKQKKKQKYCKKYDLKSKVGEKVIKNTLENDFFVEEIRDFERNYLWKGIKFKDLPNIPTINDPIGQIKLLPIGKNTLGKVGNSIDNQQKIKEYDDKPVEIVKIGVKE